MAVWTRTVRLAAMMSVVTAAFTSPAGAGQNAYAGVLASATCSPGVAFTAVSMSWDLGYLENTDFGGLGPCAVPDLSDLLGTWTMVRQEVQVGPQTLVSNVAGKLLQILPRAVFELDSSVRGVMAQEEWGNEKFCIEGAAASLTCGAPLPALPSGLGAVPCRDSAVFTGAVRSDVYVQASGAPTLPVGPFTLRANIRTDMVPIAVRCPGASVDVTCRNCASMSIGMLTMALEYDVVTGVLTAISDVGGRRLVQTYRRETTVTLDQIFNADGSLK